MGLFSDAFAKAFDESKFVRDDHGRFAEKPGGGGTAVHSGKRALVPVDRVSSLKIEVQESIVRVKAEWQAESGKFSKYHAAITRAKEAMEAAFAAYEADVESLRNPGESVADAQKRIGVDEIRALAAEAKKKHRVEELKKEHADAVKASADFRNSSESIQAEDRILELRNESRALEHKQKMLSYAENPSFREWFGGSTTVDDDGLPLVIYHGTQRAEFVEFNESSGRDVGVFGSTDKETASTYSGGYTDDVTPLEVSKFEDIDKSQMAVMYGNPEIGEYETKEEADQAVAENDLDDTSVKEYYVLYDSEGSDLHSSYDQDEILDAYNSNPAARSVGSGSRRGKGLYPLFFALKNPLIIEGGEKNWDDLEEASDGLGGSTREISKVAKEMGYDGVIFRDIIDSGGTGSSWVADVFVAFSASDIKSLHNAGDFSSANDDILKSLRGSFTKAFDESKIKRDDGGRFAEKPGKKAGDKSTVSGARGEVEIIHGALEGKRFNDFDEDEPDAAVLSSDIEDVSGKFGYSEEDDDYLYHVTTREAAEEIKYGGLTFGNQPMFSGYENHSKGRVFFSERSGVKFWQGRVEDQLSATKDYDEDEEPEDDVVVVKVPKESVRGTLQTDLEGTRDAGHDAYFVEREDPSEEDDVEEDDVEEDDVEEDDVEEDDVEEEPVSDIEAALEQLGRSDLEDDEVFSQELPDVNKYDYEGSYGDVYVHVRPEFNGEKGIRKYGPHEFFFYDQDDNPIGFARATKGDNRISFSMIGIHPDFQGKGLGTDAYRFFLEEGYDIVSDKEQTDGTQAIYRKLAREYGASVEESGKVVLHGRQSGGSAEIAKAFSAVFKNCGTGDGGFKAGNTCAKGDGSGESSGGDKTDTPEFRKWFGDSKIVNDDGSPRVVYHGTKSDFDEFSQDKISSSELGFHFGSTSEQAEFRVADDDESKVLLFYLSISNPIEIPDGSWSTEEDIAYWASENGFDESGEIVSALKRYEESRIALWDELQDAEKAFGESSSEAKLASKKRIDAAESGRRDIYDRVVSALKKSGYDGVVYDNEIEGDGESYIAFDPRQIKSVDNEGTFDPKSPKFAKAFSAVFKNCGTGDGGFKAGNTCGKSGGAKTDSPEFRAWFGHSQVVNDDGSPLVVYRGTQEADKETQRFGVVGATFASSNPDIANSYAGMPDYAWEYMPENMIEDLRKEVDALRPAVSPFYMRIEDPLEVDAAGGHVRVQDLIDEAIAGGHDGLIVRNSADTAPDSPMEYSGAVGDVFVVFDRKQIKSATGNNGAFSRESSDITKSLRGSFAKAFDESKFVRDDRGRFAEKPGAKSVDLIDGQSIVIPQSFTYGEIADAKVESIGDGKFALYRMFTNYEGEVSKNVLVKGTQQELRLFLNDISGRLEHPADSGNDVVDAVLSGQGEYLGRGQGGVVFGVGDKVVKASSIVPFHWNQGLRSIAEGNQKLRDEVKTVKTLAELGVPGVLTLEAVEHDGRVFAIRDKVRMDGFDQQAIDDAGEALSAMHKAGYLMRDQIQIGMGEDGKFRFYDVSEAAKIGPDSRYADEDKDSEHESLQRFAKQNGLSYRPPRDRDVDMKLEDVLESAMQMLDRQTPEKDIFRKKIALEHAFHKLKTVMPDSVALYEPEVKETLERLGAAWRKASDDELEQLKSGDDSSVAKSLSAAFSKAFDESKVKRDEDGKFTEKPGGASAAVAASVALSEQAESLATKLASRRDYPQRFKKFFEYDWSDVNDLNLSDEEMDARFDLREEFSDEFVKFLGDYSPGFKKQSADEQEGRRKILRGVFLAIGPRMAQKIVKEVGDTWHHDDCHHLTESVMSYAGKSREEIQKKLASTSRSAGAYAYEAGYVAKGILFLGSGADLPNEQLRMSGLAANARAENTYPHELGHVIGMQGQFSATTEWKSIWQEEISSGWISDYATVSPEEGFAEAFRLLVNDREVLRNSFPRSYRFFIDSFDRIG